MRILIYLIYLDSESDPTFHFNVDPDSGPRQSDTVPTNLSVQWPTDPLGLHLESLKLLNFYMRIRIHLFTLLRIQIQLPKIVFQYRQYLCSLKQEQL
jgi:hypothetical protein